MRTEPQSGIHNIIAECIFQAFKDYVQRQDKHGRTARAYFYSELFQEHCDLLGISAAKIRRGVEEHKSSNKKLRQETSHMLLIRQRMKPCKFACYYYFRPDEFLKDMIFLNKKDSLKV